MNFKNAIVLTGGIATGKSSVCSLLKLYGFAIIDADLTAHKILNKNVEKIANLFGNAYIKNDKVDRKKLGDLIFSDKSERVKLEKLLHPLIKEDIIKQSMLCENKNIPYIIDIPLFFETKNYDIKEIVVVYCTKEQQLERLINRENLSLNEAENRIDSQMDIEKKKVLAAFVIDNTKNLKHLQVEVERFLDYIRNKYANIKI